ncbi:MAG: site-specific integrase [Bacteroidetes bacterium]|nr:site-specific integrase [Bacteroidota bacterium]
MKNTQKLLVSFRILTRRSKNGEAPIYVKIYVDSKRLEIATGYSINPKFWNNATGEIRSAHPEYLHYNTKLGDIKSEIKREFLLMTATQRTVTVQELKKKYLKVDDKPLYKTICEAFDFHNIKVEQLVKAGKLSAETLLRYKITKNKIVDFMKVTYNVSDRSLNDLKYSFITDLEHYFLTNQKLHNNTTYKYIKNFKKIITMAVNNDWMGKNPFMQFKSQYHWKDREVLTQEEIDLLINKEFSSERLIQVRDVFVFCCYTGFAYADIHKFEHDAVIRGLDGEFWLTTTRKKSKVKESVPLLPKALEIIQKYKDCTFCIANNKLLPVKSNQKYNEYIQEIASLCGIKKHLTTHIARHTFATTITLSNGVPIETVSSMLGHKNIKTTQIYAKVVEQKVSTDMKLLKERLSAREVLNVDVLKEAQ